MHFALGLVELDVGVVFAEGCSDNVQFFWQVFGRKSVDRRATASTAVQTKMQARVGRLDNGLESRILFSKRSGMAVWSLGVATQNAVLPIVKAVEMTPDVEFDGRVIGSSSGCVFGGNDADFEESVFDHEIVQVDAKGLQ